MPTTSTPRPRHSRDKDSSRGISCRHGVHQVAQKLIINDLSRHVAMEVGLPVRSAKVKVGNLSGTFNRGMAGPSGVLKSPGTGGLASPTGTRTPPAGVAPPATRSGA